MEKKHRMKKILKVVGKIGKGIIKGVFDVTLPNVQNTIKVIDPQLPDEKKKLEIDFPRLITAITIWILLILVFFGKIKASDVMDVITKLLLMK
jgi:hypothetical protein